MCIRDRLREGSSVVVAANVEATTILEAEEEMHRAVAIGEPDGVVVSNICLLYTSDAADERSSVDLGGRRIIKKKNN